MAKRSKKRRKGTAKNLYLADDKVSVVSSAHASNRVPKALQSLKALRQDAAETLEDGATEQEDDEDFVPDTWELRSTRTSRNQSEMATVREHEGSIVYPYDIWESISNYIRPEDICTFSVLCRSAYAVVNKAKFWMRLYQDLYREDAPLPSHLTPDCMARRHQLKLHVIRSLYFVYGPFKQRLLSLKRRNDAHVLKGSILLQWWQVKWSEKEWRCYFKFQKRPPRQRLFSQEEALRPRHLENTEFWQSGEELVDVFYNPDEHCSLLQLHCSTFSHISPELLSKKLLSVNLSISVEQSLVLAFVPSHQRSDLCNDLLTANISGLKGLLVVPWHYPQYEQACKV